MTSHELLRTLPLAAAALWLVIGLRPLVRRETRSPFERAMSAFASLLGLGALLDWAFLATTDPASAIAISNVRTSAITAGTFALLLGLKWLSFGHSRRDPLLAVPVLASLGILWTGLTSGVEFVWWGYALWASQQAAYVGASIALAVALFVERRNMPRRLRWRAAATGGSLLLFLAIWIATNIYSNLTQTAGIPWLSSLLIVPGVIALASFPRVSSQDVAAVLRAVADVQRNVRAVYLFHESGEPLVALASGATFPIEAERLQGILQAVGGFVEGSVDAERGYGVTGLRFDEQGVVAVRGRNLIAAALYDGPVYDIVRSDLLRIVRDLEERHWQHLGTWEEASRVVESAVPDLSALLAKPTRTTPRSEFPLSVGKAQNRV